jgi:hypothetical protein
MKTLLCALILATLGSVAAKADDVTITFDQPIQAGLPGSTIEFFGTITNNTNATIFLNNDDLNLISPTLGTIDQFFATVPVSLAPNGQLGDSSGNIELFDVTITAPFDLTPGTYTLFGGADGGAQDSLGSAGFTVEPVPEPSSIYLVLGGFSTLLPIAKRRFQQAS